MKKFNKILAGVLTAAMLLGLSACGSASDATTNKEANQGTDSQKMHQ